MSPTLGYIGFESNNNPYTNPSLALGYSSSIHQKPIGSQPCLCPVKFIPPSGQTYTARMCKQNHFRYSFHTLPDIHPSLSIMSASAPAYPFTPPVGRTCTTRGRLCCFRLTLAPSSVCDLGPSSLGIYLRDLWWDEYIHIHHGNKMKDTLLLVAVNNFTDFAEN